MKILMLGLGSLFFISSLSQAAFIIEPNNNDRAYSLTQRYKNSLLSFKDKFNKKKEYHCRYQLNDYRKNRGSEIGCATNKNKMHSISYKFKH